MTKASFAVGNGIRWVLAVGAISLLASQHAKAVNLFWSSNGTTQGAAGTWNTTVGHFSSANANPYSTIWNNTGQLSGTIDSAEFGGTAGQVNLTGPIVVNTIQTDITGFNIGNTNVSGATNTITFSGTNAGVNVVGAANTTTISAVMNGTVVKSGAGRMELGNGNNPNTIKYVLTGGSLTSASIARLSGTAPAALVPDFFTFNGGGWAINTGNQDTGANRGITVKSGGAFFGTSSTTINITISSPIVGTEGGAVTVTNGGPFTGVSGSAAGGFVTLNNTGNSWNGGLTIESNSTVKLGQAGVIPDASTVTLQGTNGALNLSTFSETVGTVILNGASTTLSNGTITGTSYDLRASGTTSAILAGTGVVATKSTAGVVTLTGANTFTGGFNLNAGTVRIGSNTGLGAATSAVTIAAGTLASNSGTARTANYAYSVTGDFILGDATGTGAVTMNGTVDLTAGTRTITVNNATDTIGGVISNGSLKKAGTGILVMGNTNTYSGTTQIDAGAVNLQAATSTLGNGTGSLILNGGKLTSSANRVITSDPVPNPVSLLADSGISTTSSAGTVNLAFTSNSVSGTAGKTLTFKNEGANDATDVFKPRFMGSGFNFQSDAVVDNGTTGKTELDLANTGATTQTFSGKISGNGTLNRTSGAAGTGNGGDTILSGNNTYSGGTILEEGKIGLGSSSTGTSGPIGTAGVTIAQNSTGLYASGAARSVDNAVTFTNATPGSGTEFSGSNDLEMSGTVNLGAVSRTLNVTNTAKTTLSGVISDSGGTGGIVKQGGGVLILTGANTYGTTGVTSTTVSAGRLLVNNTTGSGTGPGNVLVNGGILGGTGSIAGSVSITSGSLSPGASINILNIGGNLSMTGGSFDYEINSSSATADLNNVSGNLALSTVALSASELDSGMLAFGTKFTLINYGGSWNNGIFTGLPNYSTSLVIGANRFAIRYDDTTGGSNFSGGSVGAGSHYVTITAVPEASTFLVIGLGGVFAFAAVRLGKRVGVNVLKA